MVLDREIVALNDAGVSGFTLQLRMQIAYPSAGSRRGPVDVPPSTSSTTAAAYSSTDPICHADGCWKVDPGRTDLATPPARFGGGTDVLAVDSGSAR